MNVIICPHCGRIERVRTAYTQIQYRCDACEKKYKIEVQNGHKVAVAVNTEQAELKLNAGSDGPYLYPVENTDTCELWAPDDFRPIQREKYEPHTEASIPQQPPL